MRSEIVAATNALEGFATFLDTFWVPDAWHRVNASWNTPPLSRQDLQTRSRRLAERLKALRDDEIGKTLLQKVSNLPDQISWFQANTIPQLPGGNAQIVVSIFDMMMSNIEQSLPLPKPAPDWEEVEESNLIPTKLARRIRNLEAALARIEPRAGDLDNKVRVIEEAHSTASDLPADMMALKEARDEIVTLKADANHAAAEAVDAGKKAANALSDIEEQNAAAKQIMIRIDQAYTAATSAGLAGAFKKRASQLGWSTWVWVFFLFCALVAGGYLGQLRLNSFQSLVSNPQADARWIWLEAAMSMLALAAPVWFAWLSTRQIGQRFKLAEDYGFKAAVAQAYEGYRKEAARLDPDLEARLFASALDRLEEPPSRFLPQVDHNSPYEALLESAGFQKAFARMPDLQQTMRDLLDRIPNTSASSSRLPTGLSSVLKRETEKGDI